MKKAMILLLVALFVTAMPAYGRNLWVGDPVTGIGTFHLASNWADGYIPGTGSGDAFEVRNSGTVLIYEGDVLLPGTQIRIGYWTNGSGHVEVNADVTVDNTSQSILTGEYLSRTMGFAMATFTQNDGTVNTGGIFNGRNDGTDLGMGYGGYIITGGTLNCGLVRNGDDLAPVPADKGMGLFKVVGDAATINCTEYLQNVISTTEIVLTGAGDVSLIDVSGDAILEGTLLVDVGTFSGVKTIDVLTAGGTLDYSALSCAYALSDNGTGTLQVTVPEPITLTLLGFGGIGVLIRRRRK